MGEDGKSGVIGALQAEVDAVDELVGKDGAYADWMEGIEGVKEQYEKLITKIQEARFEAKGLPDYNSNSFANPMNQIGLHVVENGGIKGAVTKYAGFNSLETGELIGRTDLEIKENSKWKYYPVSYKNDRDTVYYVREDALGGEKYKKLLGFDTGGYTGEWGPDGKLAMLHQKELVLNQDDTANLLTAVDMLRVILKTLDIQALNAQLGGLLSAPSLYHNETGVLEQNVKIEASFPGVQDRHELEEAFNNLINKAS
jgi:hypothetical protein